MATVQTLINLTANVISVKLRRETLNDKEYLVAPVRMVVQGVLKGSQGALYYPAEEISANPTDWNGMPIVAPTHPVDADGVEVSARSPEILSSHAVGTIFRTVANVIDDGRTALDAEAWFDEKASNRVDPRILSSIKAGKPVELSTGLFTENHEPLENEEAVFNGVPYDFIARNYKPDHLAILPDEVGACSLKDGCGVLVNKRKDKAMTNKDSKRGLWRALGEALGITSKVKTPTPKQPAPSPTPVINKTEEEEDMAKTATKLTPTQRSQVIGYLTTNCGVWKEKGGKESLSKMTDKQLLSLKANTSNAKKYTLILNKVKTLRINADGVEEGEAAPGVSYPELAKLLGIEIDPTVDPVGFVTALKDALGGLIDKLGGGAAETEAVVEEPVVMMEGEEEEPNTNEADEMLDPLVGQRNSSGRHQTMNTRQWMQQASPEIREAVRVSLETAQQQKKQLLQRLTANMSAKQKKEAILKFGNKSVQDLRDLISLLPRESVYGNGAPLPNYEGAGGGIVDNSGEFDENDTFPLPGINYKELSDSFRQ